MSWPIDSGVMTGAITALLLFAFVGIAVWTYGGRRRAHFEQAARLPFLDQDFADEDAP